MLGDEDDLLNFLGDGPPPSAQTRPKKAPSRPAAAPVRAQPPPAPASGPQEAPPPPRERAPRRPRAAAPPPPPPEPADDDERLDEIPEEYLDEESQRLQREQERVKRTIEEPSEKGAKRSNISNRLPEPEYYDTRMSVHVHEPNANVTISRTLPRAAEVGTVPAPQIPTWGALVEFLRNHPSYEGDETTYSCRFTSGSGRQFRCTVHPVLPADPQRKAALGKGPPMTQGPPGSPWGPYPYPPYGQPYGYPQQPQQAQPWPQQPPWGAPPPGVPPQQPQQQPQQPPIFFMPPPGGPAMDPTMLAMMQQLQGVAANGSKEATAGLAEIMKLQMAHQLEMQKLEAQARLKAQEPGKIPTGMQIVMVRNPTTMAMEPTLMPAAQAATLAWGGGQAPEKPKTYEEMLEEKIRTMELENKANERRGLMTREQILEQKLKDQEKKAQEEKEKKDEEEASKDTVKMGFLEFPKNEDGVADKDAPWWQLLLMNGDKLPELLTFLGPAASGATGFITSLMSEARKRAEAEKGRVEAGVTAAEKAEAIARSQERINAAAQQRAQLAVQMKQQGFSDEVIARTLGGDTAPAGNPPPAQLPPPPPAPLNPPRGQQTPVQVTSSEAPGASDDEEFPP